MIHIQHKRFQVVLWEDGDRSGPALQLEFDTAEAAGRELATHRDARRYATGILLEWHKNRGEWVLIEQYPDQP
jgi:hypothetical protein